MSDNHKRKIVETLKEHYTIHALDKPVTQLRLVPHNTRTDYSTYKTVTWSQANDIYLSIIAESPESM